MLKELRAWSHFLQRVNKVKFAVVAANYHYAGFAPATANSFRKLVGLKEAVWEEMKHKRLWRQLGKRSGWYLSSYVLSQRRCSLERKS